MTAPTPALVQVPAISGSVQANVDGVVVTTAAGVVQRQVTVTADPENPGNYQSVDAQGNAQTRIGPSNAALLTPAIVNFSTEGDQTIIEGVVDTIIRVFRMKMNIGGPTNLTYRSGADALTGAQPFLMGGGEYLDISGEAWYTCAQGESFIINSSAAAQVGGTIWYVQE